MVLGGFQTWNRVLWQRLNPSSPHLVVTLSTSINMVSVLILLCNTGVKIPIYECNEGSKWDVKLNLSLFRWNPTRQRPHGDSHKESGYGTFARSAACIFFITKWDKPHSLVSCPRWVTTWDVTRWCHLDPLSKRQHSFSLLSTFSGSLENPLTKLPDYKANREGSEVERGRMKIEKEKETEMEGRREGER